MVKNNRPHYPLFLLLITLVFTPTSSAAFFSRSLTINNATDTVAYGCFYYDYHGVHHKAGMNFHVPAATKIKIMPPAARTTAHRLLFIAQTPHLLKTTLTPPYAKKLGQTPTPIGWGQPTDITITYKKAQLTTIPTAVWAQEEATRSAREQLCHQSPHYKKVAKVMTGEAPYLFLESQLNERLEQIVERPRIAVCASGGGFRAMGATLGLLAGLEEIDILKDVISMAVLSGSSWALAPWIISQKPIAPYIETLANNLSAGIFPRIIEQYRDFAALKEHNKILGRPTNIIDFYGLALSHTLLKPLLGDRHTSYTLSDLATSIDTSRHPLPLFTACTRTGHHDYQWMTFTPWYTFGPDQFHAIPTWALGRSFSAGRSLDILPEHPLGYLLGTFGSSFSLSIRDAFERGPTIINTVSKKLLQQKNIDLFLQAAWANKKISPGIFTNYLYDMPGASHQKTPTLAVVDGGYRNNLPLLPLMNFFDGNLDVIIVIDSKRERDTRVENFAHALTQTTLAGYEMPLVNYDMVANEPFSLFLGDTEKNIPSIIYITLEGDATYDPSFTPCDMATYSTQNLRYSPTDLSKLSGLVAHHITSHHDLFKKVYALYRSADPCLQNDD